MTPQPRKTASQFADRVIAFFNYSGDDEARKEVLTEAIEQYLLQESGELVRALDKSYSWLNHYINVNRSHPHPKDFDMGLAYIRETLDTFRSRHKQLWLGSQEKEQQ